MITLRAVAYRHESDDMMTGIENHMNRPTVINPLYLVAVKPTAQETSMVDLMMNDGMVYRVSVYEPQLDNLIWLAGAAADIGMDRINNAITDFRLANPNTPEEDTGA